MYSTGSFQRKSSVRGVRSYFPAGKYRGIKLVLSVHRMRRVDRNSQSNLAISAMITSRQRERNVGRRKVATSDWLTGFHELHK